MSDCFIDREIQRVIIEQTEHNQNIGMLMVDFHTHILPSIDDGSRNMEETKAMLEALKDEGVDSFVATPHFYARHSSVHHFLEKRSSAAAETGKYLAEHPSLPGMRVGAEVYYFEGIGDAKQICELTVEGTKTLLLEMPFSQWTRNNLADVSGLIYRQDLKVVLVHIERFYRFQKDRTIWNEILKLPVVLQVNTTALSGSFMERRTALSMMKLGLPVILGSDCHNMNTRPPKLAAGRELIRKKIGEAALASCDRMAEKLLEGAAAPADGKGRIVQYMQGSEIG